MATLPKALELLEELRAASYDVAEKELRDLKEFAAKQGALEAKEEGGLKHWDMTFWAERLKEAAYELKEEELRPYFSLPKVMDGMFALAQRLFGVTITPADGEAPVWSADVRFYKVSTPEGQPLVRPPPPLCVVWLQQGSGAVELSSACACVSPSKAYFYLDPYSRPAEKRGGAWMDEVVGRSKLLAPSGSAVRLPVAHMVCNQSPPIGDQPSLMTFREVETMFHEFGHALQVCLSLTVSPTVSLTVSPSLCLSLASLTMSPSLCLAAHADARGRGARERHPRRRVGRRGAAVAVHGELVLPQAHDHGHRQALRDGRDAAGRAVR
jgi:oligopeptidase A